MLQYHKSKLLTVSIHILIWAVLFTFPYFMFSQQVVDYGKLLTHNWLPLTEYAILFYLNYFVFLNRFLFRKKYVIYFLLNTLVIALFLYLNFQFRETLMKSEIQSMFRHRPMNVPLGNGAGFPKPMQPPTFFFIFKDIFSFLVPLIFSIAVRATENWIKTEAEKKEIENKNLETELQHLRYQLQPHFFFNSLNNIYALIELSPDKAQEAVHSLSKLMRYMLYETSRKKVDLYEEIEFLRKYIQLMELRQSDKTVTNFLFPEIERNTHRIAPLLFIAMIENAYKHGVSSTKASVISFELTIKDNELLFYSENSNFPKTEADKSGSGIGLENLKKRLDLLYAGKYKLDKGLKDDMYYIRLQIVLK